MIKFGQQFICITFFLLSSQAFGLGGDISGGGKAVVCRDSQNKITSAELLDLWEGRMGIFPGGARAPLPSAKDYRGQIEDISQRMGSFAVSRGGLSDNVSLLLKDTTFLPAGERLEPSVDALPVLLPPQGCVFEQAAAYNTRLEHLFLDSEIWGAFNETSRAALLVHESIYDLLRRQSGETDSFYTRQVVSYLFATAAIPAANVKPAGHFYDCSAGPAEGTNFFLYEDPALGMVVRFYRVNHLPLFFSSPAAFGGRGHDGPPIFNDTKGKPLSIDQLAGQVDVDTALRAGESFMLAFHVGKNGPADTGWMSALRFIRSKKSKRLELQIGHYRAGDGDENLAYTPATCSDEKHD